MRFVRMLPVIFAGIIFSAHVLRFYGVILALLSFLFIFTLLAGKRWVLRVWQVYLSGATLVWISATIGFIRYRMAVGMPWGRLALIMGVVIALTVFSIFWLENKKVKEYYDKK